MGALPAFIFAGLVGLSGIAITAAGGSLDLVGTLAFGPFLGPHIAFAGGVAAAAYSHKNNQLESGCDIATPLAKFSDPMTLIVGGLFGGLGYVINYLYASVLHLPTDTVAMTVITTAIIARFMFGNSGIVGDTSVKDRDYYPKGKSFLFLSIAGIALGLVVSHYTVETGIVTLGFCISAASLMFAQMGHPCPATHHISLVAAYAALATGNIWIGALFGLIAALFGEFVLKTFNSHCDTHIDPPAFTIFVWAFIIFIFL
ncbi:hypothetical protein ISU02_22705 [Fusibacter sp. Q10-2]|uniref:DUF7973 domain-containing protein n=1 Tax=Fusibacter ferrireducens TaxID=2785058 RepID=A0ABR9ZZP7_9FIRM|nr:hypothetical protein [Fusibacter ferrireducens]